MKADEIHSRHCLLLYKAVDDCRNLFAIYGNRMMTKCVHQQWFRHYHHTETWITGPGRPNELKSNEFLVNGIEKGM